MKLFCPGKQASCGRDTDVPITAVRYCGDFRGAELSEDNTISRRVSLSWTRNIRGTWHGLVRYEAHGVLHVAYPLPRLAVCWFFSLSRTNNNKTDKRTRRRTTAIVLAD